MLWYVVWNVSTVKKSCEVLLQGDTRIEQSLTRRTLIQGVPGGNVPDFGRMFLTLKYTDITQKTYVYPKLNGYGDNGERSLKV